RRAEGGPSPDLPTRVQSRIRQGAQAGPGRMMATTARTPRAVMVPAGLLILAGAAAVLACGVVGYLLGHQDAANATQAEQARATADRTAAIAAQRRASGAAQRRGYAQGLAA